MENRKKKGSNADYYSPKEIFRDDEDEFSETEKKIGLMFIVALLISALIILAGATYSISVRSTSPYFQCLKNYEKKYSSKQRLDVMCRDVSRNIK